MITRSLGQSRHQQALFDTPLERYHVDVPDASTGLPVSRVLFGSSSTLSPVRKQRPLPRLSFKSQVHDVRLPRENTSRGLTELSEKRVANQFETPLKSQRSSDDNELFFTPTNRITFNDALASSFEALKPKLNQQWTTSDSFPNVLAVLKLVQQKRLIVGGSFALLLHEMNHSKTQDGYCFTSDFSRAPHDLDLWQGRNELVLDSSFLKDNNMVLKGCITDSRLSLSCGLVSADIFKSIHRKGNPDLKIKNIEECIIDIMGLKVLSLTTLLSKLNLRINDADEINTNLNQWKNDIEWIKQLDPSIKS